MIRSLEVACPSEQLTWTMNRLEATILPTAEPPESPRRTLGLLAMGIPVGQVSIGMQRSESCLRRYINMDDVEADRKDDPSRIERKGLLHVQVTWDCCTLR